MMVFPFADACFFADVSRKLCSYLSRFFTSLRNVLLLQLPPFWRSNKLIVQGDSFFEFRYELFFSDFFTDVSLCTTELVVVPYSSITAH